MNSEDQNLEIIREKSSLLDAQLKRGGAEGLSNQINTMIGGASEGLEQWQMDRLKVQQALDLLNGDESSDSDFLMTHQNPTLLQ